MVFRVGRRGQFIGCSNYPVCAFTLNEDGSPTRWEKEIVEWDEYGKPTSYAFMPIVVSPKPKPCPYKKCDGKGKVPYIDKNGHTWSNMWITCECSWDNPREDHYQPIYPEDYDFPMSYDFRSWVEYQATGKALPTSIKQFEQTSTPTTVFPSVGKRKQAQNTGAGRPVLTKTQPSKRNKSDKAKFSGAI